MSSSLEYTSRESLPQFSNFEYREEEAMIPTLETDYNSQEIQRVLSEEGAVLVQNANKEEILEAMTINFVDKVTSLSEVKRALNPVQTRGVAKFYESEEDDSIYLTENQYRTRFL